MNMFIYDPEGSLQIRKPNGLEYGVDKVDKPDLGFEYDVLVYDQEEFKIVSWKADTCFDEQEKSPLTDEEKDAVEQYIENSVPPLGHTLGQQYVNKITDRVRQTQEMAANEYGFDSFHEAVYAGRQGSNHPYRANARMVLEFVDALYCQLDLIINEISQTREDYLKDISHYVVKLPSSAAAEDNRQNHQGFGE